LAIDLTNAKDAAKEFLLAEVSADRVGGYLENKIEATETATYYFSTLDTGYRGWMWAVNIGGDESLSLNEIVLIPGKEALLAPKWVPWQERLQEGDLGIGDVLPTAPDDARLVPGYTEVDDLLDESSTPVGWEAGLGRKRVLSEIGREQAVNRWYGSSHGPNTAMAELATDKCVSCGFYIPLSGALGRMFGVCANSYAQDDAKVVSLDHGCGGHSEVIADTKSVPVGTTVVNEEGFFDATEIDEDSIEEEIDLADADLQEVDEFAHDGEEVDDDDDDEDDEAAEDAEANRLDVLDEVLNNNEEN
jgi:hypothetical protein